MKHFSVTPIGEEIIATFSDGTNITIVKQAPTDEFIMDCAFALDEIARKISDVDKKKGK